MFDTMTLTKITGAFCGALLVYLLGAWAAEELYHVGGGHGHDGEEAKMGYAIEVAAASTGEVVEEVPFAELLASADAAKGAKVFSKCKACHKLDDGANGTGPHLFGIVDRPVEAASGFAYSGALSKVVATWTPEDLNAFIESPKGYTPGTAMAFNGLKKPADRANLVAYLQSLQ